MASKYFEKLENIGKFNIKWPACQATLFETIKKFSTFDHNKVELNDFAKAATDKSIRVAITRHPFTRLRSAWRDKSRKFISDDGVINVELFRKWGRDDLFSKFFEEGQDPYGKEATEKFAKKALRVRESFGRYSVCTSIFEKEKLSEDFYYSWEAFIKYVVALGSARDTLTGNNVHWADYWDECKPCHFHYDYITHLDQEMFKAHFRSNIFTSGHMQKCQIHLPSRKSSDILFP